jgi:hypothetical protein
MDRNKQKQQSIRGHLTQKSCTVPLLWDKHYLSGTIPDKWTAVSRKEPPIREICFMGGSFLFNGVRIKYIQYLNGK